MQLLYLYIPDYGILKDVELNFTANHRFEYNKETRTVEELAPITPLSDDFFSLGSEENVVESISAIVGNNGAGKTSVANFLHKIDLRAKTEYIMICKIANKVNVSSFIVPTYLNDQDFKTTLRSIENSKQKTNIRETFYKFYSFTDGLYKLDRNKKGYENFKRLWIQAQGKYTHNKKLNTSFNLKSKFTIGKPKFDFIYSSNFYTPMHDLETINRTYDISTSNLIENENETDRYYNRHAVDTISIHRENDYIRNAKFLQAFENNVADIDWKMKFPKGCRISTNSTDLNFIDNELGSLPDDESMFKYNSQLELLINISDTLKGKGFVPNIIGNFIINKMRYEYFLQDDEIKSNPLFKILTSYYEEIKNNSFTNYRKILHNLAVYEKENFQTETESKYGNMILLLDLIENNNSKISDNSIYLSIKDNNDYTFFIKFISIYFKTTTFTSYLSFDWIPFISSGEYAQLNIYSRLYHLLRTESPLESTDIVLFMDEIEITIHPDLQKDLVKNLITFLNIFYKGRKVHIIFATHSPILLSDIPQSNTILLERKNDEVTVKPNAEFPETFGANIHSLYRNSFLLQDGTMGSFATGKIKALIDTINKLSPDISKDKRKHIEDQIAIIGEPFMKRKIQELYWEKTSPSETQKLQTELSELEAKTKKVQEKLRKKMAENHDTN